MIFESPCHSKSLSLQSISLSTTIYGSQFIEEWLSSQGRVSLEQRLGTALHTAILLILSLFLCCFLKSDLLDTLTRTYTIPHTL